MPWPGAAVLIALLLNPGSPVRAATYTGDVTHVTDGDSVNAHIEGTDYEVRLAEIDAPEFGQNGHAQARRNLSRMVLGRTVQLRVIDIDQYGRIVAWLVLNGLEVNRELVRTGHAWAYRDFLLDQTLLDDEAHARSAARGLWREGAPTAPWLYRRGKRGATPVSRSHRYLGNEPRRTTLPGGFVCGSKRYCGEMSSCREARYQLDVCGLRHLDGDGDGVPCESLCR